MEPNKEGRPWLGSWMVPLSEYLALRETVDSGIAFSGQTVKITSSEGCL